MKEDFAREVIDIVELLSGLVTEGSDEPQTTV